MATSEQARHSAPPSGWSPPKFVQSRQVLPDRYTQYGSSVELPGRAVDPGRMGIYLCLLDDRAQLYPSLSALQKHRHQAHNIPPPNEAGPSRSVAASITSDSALRPAVKPTVQGSDTRQGDTPVFDVQNLQSILSATTAAFVPRATISAEDIIPPKSDSGPPLTGQSALPDTSDQGINQPSTEHTAMDESRDDDQGWLTWKFSEEETLRRKAFLPLA